jgi:hypothetical protein
MCGQSAAMHTQSITNTPKHSQTSLASKNPSSPFRGRWHLLWWFAVGALLLLQIGKKKLKNHNASIRKLAFVHLYVVFIANRAGRFFFLYNLKTI